MEKRKRTCSYYCDGYCFLDGDTGRVCDTNNNQHDGYCPMRESDSELERIADAMSADYESLAKTAPAYTDPVADMYASGHNSCILCGKASSCYLGCQDCGAVFCSDCLTEDYKCPVCGGEHLV